MAATKMELNYQLRCKFRANTYFGDLGFFERFPYMQERNV